MHNVVLDPGHGGNDRYNVGVSGKYVEPDGVLAISKKVAAKLNAYGVFNATLTRDVDKTLGLTERSQIAKDRGAELFVSEHTDAGGVGSRGTTVFYSVDIAGDKAWAEKFAAEISAALETKNRGAAVRESVNYPGEDYYSVIDNSQDLGIPHVFLIESGFHSDPSDEGKLRQDVYLERIAEAQVKVICEMFGVAYNGAAPAVSSPQPVAPQPSGSPEIRAIQEKLNRIHVRDANGNKLVEDGLSGARTSYAIRRFQTIANIGIDGKWGSITERAYQSVVSQPTCSQRTKPATVIIRYIQFRVGSGIDGAWGPNTTAAVKSWQGVHGLTPDGIIGPATWREMFSA